MDCTRCRREIGPGEKPSWDGGNPMHAACLEEAQDERKRRGAEAMENAATVAIGKWCPFPADQNCRCAADDCMAWDGYDCRRLQVWEAA